MKPGQEFESTALNVGGSKSRASKNLWDARKLEQSSIANHAYDRSIRSAFSTNHLRRPRDASNFSCLPLYCRLVLRFSCFFLRSLVLSKFQT